MVKLIDGDGELYRVEAHIFYECGVPYVTLYFINEHEPSLIFTRAAYQNASSNGVLVPLAQMVFSVLEENEEVVWS